MPEVVREQFRLRQGAVAPLVRRLARERREGTLALRESGGAIHRVVLQGGAVVAAHVAGCFDPLLERLRTAGAIDDAAFYETIEALATSDRRSGDLAREITNAAPGAIREALQRQLRDRLAAITNNPRVSSATFEPHEVRAREIVTRIPEIEIPVPRPQPPAVPPPHDPSERRRALRKLAFALHPDRHAHLSEEQRTALARELAQATAAHHGLR